MKVFNIAAGKLKPFDIKRDDCYILNMDTSYYQSTVNAFEIDSFLMKYPDSRAEDFVKYDVMEFMERTITTFDRVCIYRYLEHVSFTNILYFIYLVSTITTKGSIVDVIVPDYELLAEMIIKENPKSMGFEAHNILLTTELLNEPNYPHASIWTAIRAMYFWELEKRFIVTSIQKNYKFDGRNIYLRFQAIRQ